MAPRCPLGVVEGSTENKTVVRGLVAGLRDRGVDDRGGILFVLDGAKALRAAVKDVFGDKALVQRCLVERWFAELTRKLLQRSAHKTVKALTADLNGWIGHWNEHPKPFVWHKTADEILDNTQDLYVTNL
jgi:transposase-like protein